MVAINSGSTGHSRSAQQGFNCEDGSSVTVDIPEVSDPSIPCVFFFECQIENGSSPWRLKVNQDQVYEIESNQLSEDTLKKAFQTLSQMQKGICVYALQSEGVTQYYKCDPSGPSPVIYPNKPMLYRALSQAHEDIWLERSADKAIYCLDTGLILHSIQTFKTKEEALVALKTLQTKRKLWAICIFIIGMVGILVTYAWYSGSFRSRNQNTESNTDQSTAFFKSRKLLDHSDATLAQDITTTGSLPDQIRYAEEPINWLIDPAELFSGPVVNITVKDAPSYLFYSNKTKIIGQHVMTGSNLGDCKVFKNLALCNGAGAFILDTTELANPIETKRIILSGSATLGAIISENDWTIAGPLIDVINFKQLLRADVIASVDTPGDVPNDLLAIPKTPYIVTINGNEGITVFNRETHRSITSVPLSQYAQNAVLLDDIMHVAASNLLIKFNMSTPTSPVNLGSITATSVILEVKSYQGQLLVMEGTDGVRVINPSTYVTENTFAVPGCPNVRGIASDDTYILVTCLDRVVVFHFPDPLSPPTYIDQVFIPSVPPVKKTKVVVQKGIAYVMSDDTLTILSTPQSAILGTISGEALPGTYVISVEGCSLTSCTSTQFTLTILNPISQLLQFPSDNEAIIGSDFRLSLQRFKHVHGMRLDYNVRRADGKPLDPWLSVSLDGELTGFPQEQDKGILDLIVTASDIFGAFLEIPVTLRVGNLPTIVNPSLPPVEGLYEELLIYPVPISTFGGSNLTLSVAASEGQTLPASISWYQSAPGEDLSIKFVPQVGDPEELSLLVVATTPEDISASVPLQASFQPQAAPRVKQFLVTKDVKTETIGCIRLEGNTYFSHPKGGVLMEARFLSNLAKTTAIQNPDGSWILCVSPTIDETDTFANGKIQYEIKARPIGTLTNSSYVTPLLGDFDIVGRSKTEYAILAGSFTSLVKNGWWLASTFLLIPVWNTLAKWGLCCCVKTQTLNKNTTEFNTQQLGFYSLTYEQNGVTLPSGGSGGPRINVTDNRNSHASLCERAHTRCCKRDYTISHPPSSAGEYRYFVRGPLSLILSIVEVTHDLNSGGIELNTVDTSNPTFQSTGLLDKTE